MSKRGGGFGVVILVVVVAIVLFLTARSLNSVAPTALQVSNGSAATAVDAHGETGAAGELRDGDLPDLQEMQQETDAHAQQLQEAIEQID